VVEFRILGPLEVLEEGEQLPLPRLKERVVLAVLLLHANEFVSRERLIDDLWGEAPPPTARQAVNVYLSQLRKALSRAGEDPITTESGGYRLQVESDALDASRMQVLVASAREHASKGEPAPAAERFREALSVWRGPSLAGLPLESLGRDEVAQLDELRLAVLMDRIDCDLELGRHEHVLGELSLLVREYPLRERLRAQQMLALYRADRQADALDAYAKARQTLVDDLGIEPSEALQRLQQAILRHDPSLETAAGTAAVNGVPPSAAAPPPILDHDPTLLAVEEPAGRSPSDPSVPPEERRLSRRRLFALGAALVVLAGAAAGVVELSSGSSRPAKHDLGAIPGNSVGAVDPSTSRITSAVSVAGGPDRLASGSGKLWATTGGLLMGINPRTAKIVQIVEPGIHPTDVAAGGDAIWVFDDSSGTVAQVDPDYGSVTRRFGIPRRGADRGEDSAYGEPTSISVGRNAVWIANGPGGLVRIDPRDGSYSTISTDAGIDGVAAGGGAVWAVSGPAAEVLRLDPRTNRVTDVIPLASRPGALSPYPYMVAVGKSSVWVVNGNTDAVTKIDPTQRGVIATIPLGHIANSLGLTVGAGAAWVVDAADGKLIRIDASTNDVTSIPLGVNQARDVVFVDGAVWVSVQTT